MATNGTHADGGGGCLIFFDFLLYIFDLEFSQEFFGSAQEPEGRTE